MDKNIVDNPFKSELAFEMLPLHRRRGSTCESEFFFAMPIYLLKNECKFFVKSIDSSMNLQPQEEESSIFDSAWAALGEQP